MTLYLLLWYTALTFSNICDGYILPLTRISMGIFLTTPSGSGAVTFTPSPLAAALNFGMGETMPSYSHSHGLASPFCMIDVVLGSSRLLVSLTLCIRITLRLCLIISANTPSVSNSFLSSSFLVSPSMGMDFRYSTPLILSGSANNML